MGAQRTNRNFIAEARGTRFFVRIVGVSIWFTGRRWVLHRDGDPEEGPFLLQSIDAHTTPQGRWTHGTLDLDVKRGANPAKVRTKTDEADKEVASPTSVRDDRFRTLLL